jgi:hypothetical protein
MMQHPTTTTMTMPMPTTYVVNVTRFYDVGQLIVMQ